MIYDYFGDKDAVCAAALREAYVQIRQGEMTLNLDTLEPEEAVRGLVHFTMNHFWNNLWFIRMLNTENLKGGETIRKLEDSADFPSVLLEFCIHWIKAPCLSGKRSRDRRKKSIPLKKIGE